MNNDSQNGLLPWKVILAIIASFALAFAAVYWFNASYYFLLVIAGIWGTYLYLNEKTEHKGFEP